MNLTNLQITELRKSSGLAELILDKLANLERLAYNSKPVSPNEPDQAAKDAYNLEVDAYEQSIIISGFHTRYAKPISDSNSKEKRMFCLALGDFEFPDSIGFIDADLSIKEKQEALLAIVETATIPDSDINIIDYLINKMYEAVMFPPVKFIDEPA
jgi:hypothetical protein